MSVIVNHVRKNFYLDSVALMRMSVALTEFEGVRNASMMSATPSNMKILAEAGLLDGSSPDAGNEDLFIAVELDNADAAASVLAHAETLLKNLKSTGSDNAELNPQSLQAACEADAQANLALISVPGEFAVREAVNAIDAGLNVMIFSDNVSLESELALKQHGRDCGRLVMGPDCGTALIQGVPLAFANRVPTGDIGIIAASGTGLQEVSCLLAHAGRGTSHAIGTGGRDLSDAIGGLTTLAAIDLLSQDTATGELVLISKPAGDATRDKVLDALSRCGKPATVCFIGETADQPYPNVRICRTLAETAHAVAAPTNATLPHPQTTSTTPGAGRRYIHGLFAGGTLCAEAQLVLMDAGLSVQSNVAINGANAINELTPAHRLLDLGADEYTLGRPHPMIEPAVRTPVLEQSLSDRQVAVVLLDVVLGTGSHPDPLNSSLAMLRNAEDCVLVASVCGTDQDPQQRSRQIEFLSNAGVVVAESNAAAASIAVDIVSSLASA